MGEIDADLAERAPDAAAADGGGRAAARRWSRWQAMLRAVENGAQAALMAPTETLAEQHHRTLDSLLGGALPLELLTGSTAAARRRELLGRLASGQLQLVVGTHALIEAPVEFRDLARGRRRRAAPLRGAPARGARREGARGARAARAAHDRHADPAHALADRLRRPRRHRPARAPAGPAAGRDLRGRRRPRPGARLRAHPRGDRRGAPVLRRLPAGRGVGGAAGQGRDGRVRAAAHDRVPRPARGADPRPDAVQAEGGGDGGVRARARPTCSWPRA